jgi:hypothetical protein
MTDPEIDEQTYHPNHLPSSETGPICYRDPIRVCGPDCIAYLAQVPDGEAYKGEQWAHCHVLVNQDRLGRHAVVLVSLLNKDVSLRSKAQAEAERGKKAPGVA